MLTILLSYARNLLRNKRRTLMTLSILAVSTAIMFLTFCYLEGMYWALRYSARTATGFVQIAAKGYWDDRRDTKPIIDRATVQAVREELSRLEADCTMELEFQGLLGNERDSTIVSGVGVEAEKSGGAASAIQVRDGRVLFGSDMDRGLIGEIVAKRLGAVPGDWLTLLGQNLAGAFNPVSFQVAGVVTTGVKESDKYYLAVPLAFAQSIRQTDGAEKILVFFGSREETPAAAALVRGLKDFIADGDLAVELRTWEELASFYFELKALYDFIFVFIMIIISVLVLLAVFEITSMSFFERMREIGMLRAIGITKLGIFGQLMAEVLALYLLGNLIGAALGAGLGGLVNSLSIHWQPPGSSTSVPFFFDLKMNYMLVPLAVTFLASACAGVLPAFKAARLPVIEVLRHE
jgi:putative ABC transport system permease protein